LAELADTLGGAETHVADVSDPSSIRAALNPGDVIVSTVGPFLRWGNAAVEAAIDAGAHYLDSTGEPAFIRRVFEQYGPRASRRSSALMPASGFDWVPGNLAGALALTAAGPNATSIRTSYVLRGTSAESGGAQASTAVALLEPSFAYNDGRLVKERAAARSRRVKVGADRPHWVLSAGGTEHLTLPKLFPQLRQVEVGLGLYGEISRFVPAVSALVNAGMQFRPTSWAIRRVVERTARGSTGGPSERERAAGSSAIVAEASAADGTLLHRTVLRGVEGFTFTGNFLAWAALRAARGAVRDVGALGPVQAFDLDALTEGVRDSGIAIDEIGGR
jgi:short subunit dehydrogenase-like uncharacterized protein